MKKKNQGNHSKPMNPGSDDFTIIKEFEDKNQGNHGIPINPGSDVLQNSRLFRLIIVIPNK